jgi:hypothetical protein
MGAMAHYPIFCGFVEQLGVIAAKFGVCTMAPTHTSLQCIIETSWMDASFECHETMKDTLKLEGTLWYYRLGVARPFLMLKALFLTLP